MTTNQILLLCAGALVLGLISVVVDRLNFPQRTFVPKAVELDDDDRTRDRTGAHILDLETERASGEENGR